MKKNTSKVTEFNRSVLRKLPYRGILKQVSRELGVTSVAITRKIDANDTKVMEIVIQKMIEVNHRELEKKRHMSMLRGQAVEVVNGSLDVTGPEKLAAEVRNEGSNDQRL